MEVWLITLAENLELFIHPSNQICNAENYHYMQQNRTCRAILNYILAYKSKASSKPSLQANHLTPNHNILINSVPHTSLGIEAHYLIICFQGHFIQTHEQNQLYDYFSTYLPVCNVPQHYLSTLLLRSLKWNGKCRNGRFMKQNCSEAITRCLFPVTRCLFPCTVLYPKYYWTQYTYLWVK